MKEDIRRKTYEGRHMKEGREIIEEGTKEGR
jgi:hypothetical protein